MRLNDKQKLYIRSMGKMLRVTAVFTNDDKANAYMARHRDEGVVAVFEPLVFLASLHDHGTVVKLDT